MVAVYYGQPMWRLAQWTALNDFRASCVSDRDLGLPESAKCKVLLASPARPPPVRRRALEQTSSDFRAAALRWVVVLGIPIATLVVFFVCFKVYTEEKPRPLISMARRDIEPTPADGVTCTGTEGSSLAYDSDEHDKGLMSEVIDLDDTSLHTGVLTDTQPIFNTTEHRALEDTTVYTGMLNKKRQKRGRGYARRFFSLDFTSSYLSYYRDRHSSEPRGAIPLAVAAIAVIEKTREFQVDTGAECWHLKAGNRQDFDGWRDALERASVAANSAHESNHQASLIFDKPHGPSVSEELVLLPIDNFNHLDQYSTSTSEEQPEGSKHDASVGNSAVELVVRHTRRPNNASANTYVPDPDIVNRVVPRFGKRLRKWRLFR